MRPLTERQRQIVHLMVSGYANKQIAYRLHISQHTVTRHMANIYGRTGCRGRGRVSLVCFLLREGIIQLPAPDLRGAA